MDSLLKGSRYQSLSLGDAIARWSANEDEVLEAYRRRVEEWTGLGRDRPMSSLTPEEFARVVEAMQRQEGFWAPDPETRKKTILKGVVIHEPADPPTRPARDAPQPPSGKPAGSNRPGVPVPPPPQRRNEAPAPQKGAAAESLRPAVLGGVGDLSGFGGAAPTAPVAAPARPPAKPETGLDRLQALFGRPFEHLVQTSRGRVPVDDPAVLHVDEIDALMAAPAYRQSLHPQAEKTRATVGRWFEATYPGPVQYDATGRMIRAPRRERPAAAPPWIRDQGALSLQGPKRDLLTGAPIPGRRRPRRKPRFGM